jgi:hypothetical protein
MTTWTTLSTQNPGDRATAAWAQGIMENQIYLHEIGWHPYDMTAPDDGADGLLWDFSVSGAVASVETPNFEDGFEYRFAFFGISHSDGSSRTLDVQLYRATSAAYASAVSVTGAVAAATLLHGFVEMPTARASRQYQLLLAFVQGVSTSTLTSDMTTAQKVGKAKLLFSAGNLDAGQVYLFRRRSLIS